MKAFTLLKSLSNKEQLEIENVIKSHKRSTLQRFYFSLKKLIETGEKLEKSAVFKAVFREAFTPKKDYLLRNEGRLLSGLLTDYMVENQSQNDLKQNNAQYSYLLLKNLAQRQLYHEFELEYRKALKAALNQQQQEWVAKMMALYMEEVFRIKEINPELYDEMKELARQVIDAETIHHARVVRRLEIKIAFAERVRKMSRPDLKFSDHRIASSLEDHNDAFAKVLALEAQSFKSFGREKLDVLQKMERLLEGCQHPGMQYVQRKTFVLATSALEYFLMGEYTKADEYYALMIRHNEAHKQPLNQEILFNYFSNRIKMQDYSGAIAIFEEYRTELEKNAKVWYRFLCLIGMCHLFQKDTINASKSIPPDIQQRPHMQYFYFRFVQIIIYLQDNLAEDAEREIINFLKVVKDKNRYGIDYPTVLRFFQQYVKAIQETKDKRNKLLKELQQSLTAYTADAPVDIRDFLPLIWLRNTIK